MMNDVPDDQALGDIIDGQMEDGDNEGGVDDDDNRCIIENKRCIV